MSNREFANLTEAQLGDAIEAAVVALDFPLLDQLDTEDLHRKALARRRGMRLERKQTAYEALIAKGVDDETATEQAYGITVDRQRRAAAIAMLRAQGHEGRGLDELVRSAYREHAYGEWLRAEAATNGHMLSKRGFARGIDPRSLWFGRASVASANASEELRAWWDINGRTTPAEFKAELLNPAVAAGIRAQRGDFHR